MENEEKTKKSNLGIILIGIAILLLITGMFLFLTKGEKKDNETDIKPVSEVKSSDFDGVYKKEKTTIKLFSLGEKNVYYYIDANGGTIRSSGSFRNGNVFGSLFDENYTFSLLDNGISVETNSTVVLNGTYDKTGNYTIEEFYNDNIGDPSYLTSKYNGIYKDEQSNILMYNINEKEVVFNIDKTSDGVISSLQRNFEIKDDNTLEYVDDSTGAVSTITINDDSLTVNIVEDTLINYNGTYKKDSDITIESLLKQIYKYE